MSNLPEESTKITIFFTNDEVYQGDVYLKMMDGYLESNHFGYIGDNKFFKDEDGFFYPLTSFSKMKDMITSQLKQYLRDNKINKIIDK